MKLSTKLFKAVAKKMTVIGALAVACCALASAQAHAQRVIETDVFGDQRLAFPQSRGKFPDLTDGQILDWQRETRLFIEDGNTLVEDEEGRSVFRVGLENPILQEDGSLERYGYGARFGFYPDQYQENLPKGFSFAELCARYPDFVNFTADFDPGSGPSGGASCPDEETPEQPSEQLPAPVIIPIQENNTNEWVDSGVMMYSPLSNDQDWSITAFGGGALDEGEFEGAAALSGSYHIGNGFVAMASIGQNTANDMSAAGGIRYHVSGQPNGFFVGGEFNAVNNRYAQATAGISGPVAEGVHALGQLYYGEAEEDIENGQTFGINVQVLGQVAENLNIVGSINQSFSDDWNTDVFGGVSYTLSSDTPDEEPEVEPEETQEPDPVVPPLPTPPAQTQIEPEPTPALTRICIGLDADNNPVYEERPDGEIQTEEEKKACTPPPALR